MHVTIEQAYAEACRALGEALVRERLLLAELERRPSAPDLASEMQED